MNSKNFSKAYVVDIKPFSLYSAIRGNEKKGVKKRGATCLSY